MSLRRWWWSLEVEERCRGEPEERKFESQLGKEQERREEEGRKERRAHRIGHDDLLQNGISNKIQVS